MKIKKIYAAVSKMVNCLMTKAALKINASLLRPHNCPLSTTTNLIASFYVFYTYLELSQQDSDCPRCWE